MSRGIGASTFNKTQLMDVIIYMSRTDSYDDIIHLKEELEPMTKAELISHAKWLKMNRYPSISWDIVLHQTKTTNSWIGNIS